MIRHRVGHAQIAPLARTLSGRGARLQSAPPLPREEQSGIRAASASRRFGRSRSAAAASALIRDSSCARALLAAVQDVPDVLDSHTRAKRAVGSSAAGLASGNDGGVSRKASRSSAVLGREASVVRRARRTRCEGCSDGLGAQSREVRALSRVRTPATISSQTCMSAGPRRFWPW
jgi:hypothetical protein